MSELPEPPILASLATVALGCWMAFQGALLMIDMDNAARETPICPAIRSQAR